MGISRSLFSYTVGRKIVVAVTGLFLCSFLVVHLSLNLLLFKDDGGQTFDSSAEALDTSWIMHGMEVVLAAGFLFHIIYGVRVWLKDLQTRGKRYEMNRPSDNSSLASRTMIWSASLVFIFLVIHVKDFWVPSRFPQPGHSLSQVVLRAFGDPVYDAFYLIALVLLAYHLRHGFQSAFQTLGIRPQWKRAVDLVAIVFWLLIPIGFATMPLYFLFARQ
jgi:succinate dehydrogenase / fumarate reductase, cytochrome b subunit